ncbi:hypothetical protein [Streptomyces sp. enrichment culture]|uniref:hypothetical protein n=1 Tax=Streptomyces sp. enrichment culture TaxID=1795815 RepID=UPI003F554412
MPRITALTGTFALALAAVSLTACGTQKTADADSAGRAADAVGARHTEAPDVSAEQAAFRAMLDEVARSCPPAGTPASPPPVPSPVGDPAIEADVEPVAPTSGPEVELDTRDWCAKALHEERIARALWDLAAPTPAEVRTILNGLGYTDERIHGLEGAPPRFLIDLRDRGSRLCLDGTAAGEQTVVEGCVAPETGPVAVPSP